MRDSGAREELGSSPPKDAKADFRVASRDAPVPVDQNRRGPLSDEPRPCLHTTLSCLRNPEGQLKVACFPGFAAASPTAGGWRATGRGAQSLRCVARLNLGAT